MNIVGEKHLWDFEEREEQDICKFSSLLALAGVCKETEQTLKAAKKNFLPD